MSTTGNDNNVDSLATAFAKVYFGAPLYVWLIVVVIIMYWWTRPAVRFGGDGACDALTESDIALINESTGVTGGADGPRSLKVSKAEFDAAKAGKKTADARIAYPFMKAWFAVGNKLILKAPAPPGVMPESLTVKITKFHAYPKWSDVNAHSDTIGTLPKLNHDDKVAKTKGYYYFEYQTA